MESLNWSEQLLKSTWEMDAAAVAEGVNYEFLYRRLFRREKISRQ